MGNLEPNRPINGQNGICEVPRHALQLRDRSGAFGWPGITAGRLWNLEALVLPLSRTGEKMDMLISAVVQHSHKIGLLDAEQGTSTYEPVA
jgi:hypothetical protein